MAFAPRIPLLESHAIGRKRKDVHEDLAARQFPTMLVIIVKE